MRRSLQFGLSAAVISAAAAGPIYALYRRDLRAIEEELSAQRRLVGTSRGELEYAREGTGEPVLVSHGAGGGFNQGLLLGRDMFGPKYDVIAPSRFGYLGAGVPEQASPSDQADAYAALLDALDVERAIIVGVSAGAPSAVEMILRYRDRASALILIVPRAYAPGIEPVGAPPDSNMVMNAVMAGADFVFWLASKVARPLVVRFLGVPPEIEAKAAPDDRRKVSDIMRSILPLSRRLPGLLNDSFAVIGEWPLEQVTVPTLVISAEDDLYRTPAPARYVAQGIPDAELVILESGGHLLVGRCAEIRAAVRSFLQRRELLARAA